MDSQQIQEEEYQLQYFGFTSRDAITTFKEVMLRSIKVAIDDCAEILFKDQKENTASHENFESLYEQYEQKTLQCLKDAEAAIKSYFAIPKNILLPEDEIYVPCPASELESLKMEVKDLEEAYRKESAFNYLCRKELEILNSLEVLSTRIQCCTKNMKRLTNIKNTVPVQELLKVHQQLSTTLSTFDTQSKYLIK